MAEDVRGQLQADAGRRQRLADGRAALLQCYQRSPGDPLACADLARDFGATVDASLRSRPPRAPPAGRMAAAPAC